MSEIKLNLIDSTTILNGTIHGSIGDYCVAALSAEPETIDELVAALRRFQKHTPDFSSYFRRNSELDPEPYDAGILIIDLAARVVARESTYSLPGPCGEVYYHDGQRTDLTCTDTTTGKTFTSNFENKPFRIDDFIAPTDTTCPPPGVFAPNGVLTD